VADKAEKGIVYRETDVAGKVILCLKKITRMPYFTLFHVRFADGNFIESFIFSSTSKN